MTAGCAGGSGDKPTVLPTVSTLPTTSSPVPVPEPAKAKTPQGADAFVRYFFAQLNAAFTSSDERRISSLFNPECSTCRNYVGAVSAAKAQHQFLVGDSYVVAEVAAAPLQPLGTTVEVYGTLPSRNRVDDSGKTVKQLPAEGRFHFIVGVKRSVDGWLVSGIRLGS